MTSMLGLKLYILIGILVACFLFLIAITVLYIRLKRASSSDGRKSFRRGVIPLVSKEIPEVNTFERHCTESPDITGLGEVSLLRKFKDEDLEKAINGKSGISEVGSHASSSDAAVAQSEQVNMGWGRWYSVKELEEATLGFAEENVIGEGGYGIVYRGVLPQGTVVAIKNLLNNKGHAEKEFKVEVEAIGRVKHKNLVCLVGYCAEGARRLLVYEYVDNGTLEQWLHGDVGTSSPLTWDIRMKIAIGTAKGLAYLHEGLEPKVVHRDVKASNILLDSLWNPKVSDFGLAKLLGSDANYVTTRVMGTFGYVSPDYASTGMLNATSDVYSFGVLLMEIITGRSPVDYTRPAGEINLVDWFKGMVASRRTDELVDPLIEVPPSPRALKRVLLVCLRCIDLDSSKRPKIGQVVHMLEADDSYFRTDSQHINYSKRHTRDTMGER